MDIVTEKAVARLIFDKAARRRRFRAHPGTGRTGRRKVEQQHPATVPPITQLVVQPRRLQARDLLSEKQPSLQFVTPEQLGGTAVFLASDAAAQITGTTVSVDGGWTAR